MFKKGDIAVALFDSIYLDKPVKKYDQFIIKDVNNQGEEDESIKIHSSFYYIRSTVKKGKMNFCTLTDLRKLKIEQLKNKINERSI